MAEKKTLFILETIKKKMSKFDRKSDKEVGIATPIGDEFEYITPPKKIGSEQAAQEEKKHEDQLAQFEDDLGIEDDHVLASKANPQPETPKVEEHKPAAPIAAPAPVTPIAAAASENQPTVPQAAKIIREKHEEPNAVEVALDNARAAEAAAAAKAAIMGVPAQVESASSITSPIADDLVFAEAVDPFAVSQKTVAPVEAIAENKVPEVAQVSTEVKEASTAFIPTAAPAEDSDNFMQNSDFEVAEKLAAELSVQPAPEAIEAASTTAAPIEQAQIITEEVEVEAPQLAAEPETHEFDFSDLEKDEEELLTNQSIQPSEPPQGAKQAASADVAATEVIPTTAEIIPQKSEIIIDHLILDKPLAEAKEVVDQLLGGQAPKAAQAESHDLDAEFEKEMMSFVPQNSAVNNFQRIPQFDARKQSAASKESASVISGKAAKQASDSIQKLLDAKGVSSTAAQDAMVSNELIEAKLTQWLDKNLPEIVDRIVREELQKLMKK